MGCHTIDNGIECNFIVGVDHAINPHLHIRWLRARIVVR